MNGGEASRLVLQPPAPFRVRDLSSDAPPFRRRIPTRADACCWRGGIFMKLLT